MCLSIIFGSFVLSPTLEFCVYVFRMTILLNASSLEVMSNNNVDAVVAFGGGMFLLSLHSAWPSTCTQNTS